MTLRWFTRNAALSIAFICINLLRHGADTDAQHYQHLRDAIFNENCHESVIDDNLFRWIVLLLSPINPMFVRLHSLFDECFLKPGGFCGRILYVWEFFFLLQKLNEKIERRKKKMTIFRRKNIFVACETLVEILNFFGDFSFERKWFFVLSKSKRRRNQNRNRKTFKPVRATWITCAIWLYFSYDLSS